MTLNMAAPLRLALAAAPLAADLSQYGGEPAVFTRRPVPQGATYPHIIISPDVAIGDQDGLTSPRPVVLRDIAIYGLQPDQYRLVEQLGYAVRALFHRQKWAITPEGYDVIDIVARGPTPGPTDDDTTVARIVGLTIRLRSQT